MVFKYTPKSLVKNFLYNFVIVTSSILLIFMFGEITLRIIHLIKYKRQLFFSHKGTSQEIYTDDKLGWRATESYSIENNYKDSSGKINYIKKSTNEYGFRYFGEKNSSDIKILIIGDSFTQSSDIPDDKTYYAFMANQLPQVEIFAYGCGGYGTLQEYMILDEFFDVIKPQIVILQFCSNDFINNDYELERKSFINNNGRLRPYLSLTGHTYYRNPNHLFFISDILLENFRLINYINLQVNKLLSNIFKDESIEKKLIDFGPGHPEFIRSVETTKLILDMLKKRTNMKLILTFSVDDMQPFYHEFQKISQMKSFAFVDGIPQAVRKHEEQGYVVRGADGSHWNELGHQIVASCLVDFFKKNGICPRN